jgi:ABC-type nickel/cobalt efflux system permease component RcnA
MTALSILVVGLLLGMQHATEADHLAAVASLATRQNSLARALHQGVAWGIGHTLTLMLFAGAVLALGQVISPGLEQVLETAVGLMLIVLGADVLRRLWRGRVHFHVHTHAPQPPHVHAHSHRGEGAHAASAHRHEHAPREWPLRALAVGMMHGLAGSAALVVLSLQAVPSVAIGLGYIALFGVGSILGMATLSVAIAIPMKLSATYLGRLQHTMSAAIGIATCTLGVVMVWQIGTVRALLAG